VPQPSRPDSRTGSDQGKDRNPIMQAGNQEKQRCKNDRWDDREDCKSDHHTDCKAGMNYETAHSAGAQRCDGIEHADEIGGNIRYVIIAGGVFCSVPSR
jgi:hypothetical protein